MTFTLEDDRRLSIELASQAAKAIAPYFRAAPAIENKAADGHYDPVTEGDMAAERAIRNLLEAERPHDAILGEEYGFSDGKSGRTWVIDPIDGTRAFVSGLPIWGTLVGLRNEERALVGTAAQPFVGDFFSGGTKAYLNDKVIQVRACASLEQARIATTDPELFTAAELEAFEAISERAPLRRLGLDWYAYAHLAAGHLDVVIESGLKSHDILALIPIIEAAGGTVTNWRGESALEGGQIVAIGDKSLSDDILSLLSTAAL